MLKIVKIFTAAISRAGLATTVLHGSVNGHATKNSASNTNIKVYRKDITLHWRKKKHNKHTTDRVMFRRNEVRDPLSIKARDLWEEYQANRRGRLLKGDCFDDDCCELL